MNSPNSYKQQTKSPVQISPDFSWDDIENVFLDMDGTLLDKHYDDYFWEHYVPEVYAVAKGVDLGEARAKLLATYRSVENTLVWTDLDYWSERLDLNIAQLKEQISHLIDIHPYALDFLKYLRDIGKKTYLVTNAHPKALQVKLNRVNIEPWFEKMICSQDVGEAKEQPEFWNKLQTWVGYDKETTFFADDTARVLDSAAEYGIRHLVHIAKPSSKLPVSFSNKYQSIVNFKELIL
jgi:HAD superfamily hydrolase (TIGR01509 family)